MVILREEEAAGRISRNGESVGRIPRNGDGDVARRLPAKWDDRMETTQKEGGQSFILGSAPKGKGGWTSMHWGDNSLHPTIYSHH